MKPKPVALPRPPRAEAAVAADVNQDPRHRILDMLSRRDALAYELELVDAELEHFAVESICGRTDDTQDVETYDGTLGVTRKFVDQHEKPVGQLQWLDDLAQRFGGPGDSPGNVAGERWGSGGLIDEFRFITAGHCLDKNGGGWQRPRRGGIVIEPEEIATLMRVNFNYQVAGDTGQLRPVTHFPVVKLFEYRLGGLDYAILELGKNDAEQSPGGLFGTLKVAAQDLRQDNAMLCLIQHPSGRPKQIEAGPMRHNVGGQIAYDSLDTEGGSSGAPVLSLDGEVVGVHTNGGCSTFSGFNYGVAIDAIRNASSVIN